MKTIKFIGVAVIIATMIFAYAAPKEETGTITGKVIDKTTGEGLPGVSVIIVGTTIGAASTFDGTYVILNVPVGTYSLQAKTIGYNSVRIDSVRVVADSITTINFELSSLAEKVEDIIVEAEAPVIDKFQTSTECKKDADNISHMPVTNVADALRTESGFVQQDGRFHARGGRSGEISYMVDGIEIKNCLGGYNFNQNAIHYPPYDIDFKTEEYDRIYENEFLDALSNPLSTFSIDVDAASYTNTRRYLNDGYLPPADAVRIEEFINYFTYDYPRPEKDLPFSITTEVSQCPWAEKHKLLHIGLQGKTVSLEDIPPGNLVFLLDVSGSMRPANKLPLLKSAFKLLVDQLRDNDRVAIVVYAGASGLVLPSTPGNQKRTIIDAIDNLYSGGCTAGAAGIKLAYEIAKKNFIKDGNNRVILATDGDFNVGVSSTSELVRMIEEKREDGIFLTVLGFGQGNLKDSRMEQLADKGNGNYAYIDNIMEGKKVLVSELSATIYTIAKDVKIQLEFNPARVLAYRLVGYENRMLKKEDFNDDKKDAGEIGAGHSVTAIYEIIPAGEEMKLSDVDPLKYQRSQIVPDAYESAELLTVKFRYKKPDGDKSKLITVPALDQNLKLSKTSDNFRFSAAVAEFGMLLRDSKHKGDSSYDRVIKLASGARGEDSEGYRAEFIKLVKLARDLSKTVAEG
ncbi:MAG: von Willebrand factor type A domain-containing protein [Candidatus Zixiibacteriota bacterium]|nr:MAG: von Willebrand factor type A domain-containing protein [candidate division Zixibacteria bacterium]